MRHKGSGAAVLCIAAAWVVFGCSGDATSGSGPSGSCRSVCDKIASLRCPADDPSTCMVDCEMGLEGEFQHCPSQTASYLGCVQTGVTLECGPDGTAAINFESLRSACSSSSVALAGCIACSADPNDDACDACSKTSCCSEWRALVEHPNALDYVACAQACDTTTTPDCPAQCLDSFPAYRDAAEQVAQCWLERCPAC